MEISPNPNPANPASLRPVVGAAAQAPAADGPLLAQLCAAASSASNAATALAGWTGRGPDVGYGANASLRSSRGAGCGGESPACWTKNVNAINPSIVTSATGIIENKVITTSVLSKVSTLSKDGNLGQGIYPPSPPPAIAILTSDHDLEVASAKQPLTLANVATLPSSYSTISTTPTSDDADDSSEASFSSTASSADSDGALSNASSPVSPLDGVSCPAPSFLVKLFGSTYATEFARNGVAATSVSLPCAPSARKAAATTASVLSSSSHATKTLYVAPAASQLSLLDSERLVQLMEVAEEEHACNALVICLDRAETSNGLLEETLHSLLYVGGTIVHPSAGAVAFNSEKFVLVGLDL
ncbi:hypothetical protein EMMF5_000285 [Cystobasidiomycetes sp. EMM_F5]